jgi:hypothetical protein
MLESWTKFVTKEHTKCYRYIHIVHKSTMCQTCILLPIYLDSVKQSSCNYIWSMHLAKYAISIYHGCTVRPLNEYEFSSLLKFCQSIVLNNSYIELINKKHYTCYSFETSEQINFKVFSTFVSQFHFFVILNFAHSITYNSYFYTQFSYLAIFSLSYFYQAVQSTLNFAEVIMVNQPDIDHVWKPSNKQTLCACFKIDYYFCHAIGYFDHFVERASNL